jgi:hypothetical protein
VPANKGKIAPAREARDAGITQLFRMTAAVIGSEKFKSGTNWQIGSGLL